MLRVGRALLLLALVSAQGCWLQTGFGPDRRGDNDLETGLTTANVAELEVRWTADVGDLAREALIDGGKVFASGQNQVTALDLATGTEVWSQARSNPGGAAIAGGRLRVPSGCNLGSYDPATGAAEFAPFGPTEIPPGFPQSCVSGDALAVGERVVVPWLFSMPPVPASPICRLGIWTYGPGVAAIDLESTPQHWRVSNLRSGCGGGFPPFEPRPYGSLSSDGTLVLIPQGQLLHAVDVNCHEAAEPPLPEEPARCQLAWSVDVGTTIAGPAVALRSGDLAVPTADGRLVVIDGTTHQVAWTAEVGASVAEPLAATATTIFAAASDGRVVAFPADGCGAAACTADWTATLASPASARPSIGGDVLYVGSADGTVTAFPAGGCGAATCDSLWIGTTPSEVTGAPAIFGGTVVVGSSDGTVTAFARPDD
jgi:outer membrane protein assembly factor BamB